MPEKATAPVSVRGLWAVAWAVSAALAISTVAAKGVSIIDFDEVFRVSEDLTVYQDAAIALVNGLPLYESGWHYRMGGELILTYPPFAAFLFLPMAYTSTGAVTILWQLSCLAATAFILWAVARAEGLARPAWIAGALLGPATLLYPVASTFHYGQINLLLFALVAADVFGVVPKRFRGVGIGIAASLKLIPLGFLLVFLVRRDWASVLRATGTLAAIIAGLWILLPDASTKYWTDFAWDTGHSGVRWYVQNQSLTGPLLRAGLTEETVTIPYVILAAVVIAAVAFSALVFHLRGMETASVAVVALGVVLAAPMSFQHHWVAVIVVLVMLLSTRYVAWLPWLVAAVAVFVVGPVHWFMHKDWSIRLDQPIVIQLLASIVFLTAVAILVAAVVSAIRWVRVEKPRLWRYLRVGAVPAGESPRDEESESDDMSVTSRDEGDPRADSSE